MMSLGGDTRLSNLWIYDRCYNDVPGRSVTPVALFVVTMMSLGGDTRLSKSLLSDTMILSSVYLWPVTVVTMMSLGNDTTNV